MKIYKLCIISILTVFLINIFSGFAKSINYENIDEINSISNDIYENEIIDNEIIGNEIIDNDKVTTENKENIQENTFIENKKNEDNEIMLLDNNVLLPIGVEYRTHVQDIGWQNYVQDGKTAGTEGKSLRLEAIDIKLVNSTQKLNIKYQVHIQDIGWQNWKSNGEMAGTSGKSLRLEAIKIELKDSDNYSIMYRVHVQDIGWQNWKTDGEVAGTSGKSLRLEAIQIKIVPKVKKGILCLDTPSNGSTCYSSTNISFAGWKMANVSNTFIKAYIDSSEVSSNTINYFNRADVTNAILDYGTAEQNPKAGFKFTVSANNLSNGNHTLKIELYSKNNILYTLNSNFKVDKNLHIKYRSHVQSIGWQQYTMDAGTSGTSGKSYRIEAINIELINSPSNGKILYRTHIQDIGWQNWKSNGEMAGTTGKSLRVEAIEMKLENMGNYTVEYQVHIQDKGWSDWYIDGETAGTVGQSKRIEALRIRIVPKYKRQYNGIDVSQYNGIINWGKVKQSGTEFAFIRVGFRGYGQAGTLNLDSNFKINIQAAKQAGIPVGVYFVTQAITPAEAEEEANWVIDKIKPYGLDYPIAIDIESPGLEKPTDIPRTQNLDNTARTNLAKIFCQTIKNAGHTAIVYTNIDWATSKINMSQLSEYDTWIASYRNGSPGYNGKYSIWQYTSKGSVLGILGNVDLNYSYKKY